MLKREHLFLWPLEGSAPAESRQIEAEGHCLLRSVFAGAELDELRAQIEDVYRCIPGDMRAGVTTQAEADVYRYEMFNRSELCQRAIAHPRILAVVEPLVGADCHAINCTAWRNPPGEGDPGQFYWHTDSGPHVPRPAGVDWPDAIPYPIFVVATHIYLQDCTADDGPTVVVPTSHRSGQPVPIERRFDRELDYRGRRPVMHVARAGDVGMFVSDAWHRRTPPTKQAQGRFFLQTNYGRRDIAQRIWPTSIANQTNLDAQRRARTERERTLIGLHRPTFYDG